MAQERGAARPQLARVLAVGALTALLISSCSSSKTPTAATTTATTTATTATGGTTTTSGSPSPGTVLGPEAVPIPIAPVLAAPDTNQYPQTIAGIQCETMEQFVYHIHAHLTIFVDGQARQIPYGIGITPPLQAVDVAGNAFVEGGVCFYWLHTHSADGIIHIESPTEATYTLGQFFDVWGQPLKAGQVGPSTGALTIFLNGALYTGDPRAIPLTAHQQIQLDVGSPAPAQTLITFPTGL